MTPEEHRALDALERVSMRMASSGKRFRRDMTWQRDAARASNGDDFKMTARQARYLWLLVDLYRRQIKDDELVGFGAYVKFRGELPPIYLEGDHREPIQRKAKQPKKPKNVETLERSASLF